MRQILIGYERTRRAAKRGAGGENLTLDDAHAVLKGRSVDLIALDDALNDLARLDPQQSRIVELRFFGGLSIEENRGSAGHMLRSSNTGPQLGLVASRNEQSWSDTLGPDPLNCHCLSTPMMLHKKNTARDVLVDTSRTVPRRIAVAPASRQRRRAIDSCPNAPVSSPTIQARRKTLSRSSRGRWSRRAGHK
jgi:hypothetical protein